MPSMRCPRCGHDNPRGATSCQGCKKVRFVKKKKVPSKRSKALSKALAAPPPGEKKHLLVRIGAPPLEISVDKVYTIGRGHNCSLSIDSNRVSRVHAVIKLEDGRLLLSDRGSANGTFVSGKPVIDHVLAEGDEISIGPFVGVYRYQDPSVPAIPPTSFGGGDTAIEKGDLIRGQIAEGALCEVLQSVEFNEKTGTLFIFSLEGQGWITFVKGAPHAAESGAWEDAAAIFQLLGLKEGRFSFTDELRHSVRRMHIPITGLLLEWGRRTDEVKP